MAIVPQGPATRREGCRTCLHSIMSGTSVATCCVHYILSVLPKFWDVLFRRHGSSFALGKVEHRFQLGPLWLTATLTVTVDKGQTPKPAANSFRLPTTQKIPVVMISLVNHHTSACRTTRLVSSWSGYTGNRREGESELH